MVPPHHRDGVDGRGGRILEIATDLDPKSDFDPICHAAYGVAIETGAIDGGEGVSVSGSGGVGGVGCA